MDNAANTEVPWYQVQDSPWVDFLDKDPNDPSDPGVVYSVPEVCVVANDPAETFFRTAVWTDPTYQAKYEAVYGGTPTGDLTQDQMNDFFNDLEGYVPPDTFNYARILQAMVDGEQTFVAVTADDGNVYLAPTDLVGATNEDTFNAMFELADYAVNVKDGLFDDGLQFAPISGPGVDDGGEAPVEPEQPVEPAAPTEPAAPVAPLLPPLPIDPEPEPETPVLLPPLPVPGWNQNWALNVGHETTGFDLYL